MRGHPWHARCRARAAAARRSRAGALRRSGLRCEGVNLFLADGEAAFQEVPHAHLHVFPRFEGDGFRLAGRWGSNPPRAELDANAAAIAAALATTEPATRPTTDQSSERL